MQRKLVKAIAVVAAITAMLLPGAVLAADPSIVRTPLANFAVAPAKSVTLIQTYRIDVGGGHRSALPPGAGRLLRDQGRFRLKARIRAREPGRCGRGAHGACQCAGPLLQ